MPVATKMRVCPPAYASMDARQGRLLATEIVKDGPYVVKPHEDSRGRVVLNVVDTTRDPGQRGGPWTIRDRQEWEGVRPRGRRSRG